VLGLTAIGHAGKRVPDRAGGKPGDSLWLVGTVGDAAAGLAQLQADRNAAGPLVEVYRSPVPLLSAGQVLAPRANAMMDVSDGLLLDARRMAEASRCRVRIHLDTLPLSAAFIEDRGQNLDARLFAATGGDDYALLAALPPDVDPSTLSLPEGTTIERIGNLEAGSPMIRLVNEGRPVPLPEKLGFEHSHNQHRRLSVPAVGDRR
jgi:thiamine-monophosphate kinase